MRLPVTKVASSKRARLALIAKTDALEAVSLVLNQPRIPVPEHALDLQTDQIVQSTFCKALEE